VPFAAAVSASRFSIQLSRTPMPPPEESSPALSVLLRGGIIAPQRRRGNKPEQTAFSPRGLVDRLLFGKSHSDKTATYQDLVR
jgi:hypothetical protein